MSTFRERLEAAAGRRPATPAGPRKFLMIWFSCCATYNRIYLNQQGTAYEGRCPRCRAEVRAGVGPDGSSRRMFRAE